MRAKFLAFALLAANCSFSTMTLALESTTFEGTSQASSQKVELTIAEALEKQMKQGQNERQNEKLAAHNRMKNKAIKSLEQMLAIDGNKDMFETQNSEHGRAAISKGNQLMKRMSGKIQKTLLATLGEGEEGKKEQARVKKFEQMAQRGQNRMYRNSNSNKAHNDIFLKLMQKNHVFDSAMGSEIVGSSSAQVQAKLQEVQESQQPPVKKSKPEPKPQTGDLKANSTLVQSGEMEEEATNDQVSIETEEEDQHHEEADQDEEQAEDESEDEEEEADVEEKKEHSKKKKVVKKKEQKKETKKETKKVVKQQKQEKDEEEDDEDEEEDSPKQEKVELPKVKPRSFAQIASFKEKHLQLYNEEKHYLKQRLQCKEHCHLPEAKPNKKSMPVLPKSCPSECSAHTTLANLSSASRKSNQKRKQLEQEIENAEEVQSYESDKARLKEIDQEIKKQQELDRPL